MILDISLEDENTGENTDKEFLSSLSEQVDKDKLDRLLDEVQSFSDYLGMDEGKKSECSIQESKDDGLSIIIPEVLPEDSISNTAE